MESDEIYRQHRARLCRWADSLGAATGDRAVGRTDERPSGRIRPSQGFRSAAGRVAFGFEPLGDMNEFDAALLVKDPTSGCLSHGASSTDPRFQKGDSARNLQCVVTCSRKQTGR